VKKLTFAVKINLRCEKLTFAVKTDWKQSTNKRYATAGVSAEDVVLLREKVSGRSRFSSSLLPVVKILTE
jgi:hypothetical protein